MKCSQKDRLKENILTALLAIVLLFLYSALMYGFGVLLSFTL